MVCGCFSVLKWRKEERASSSSFQEQGIINNNVRLFSYNSLRSATRNFHPSSRIGGGGYGVVYRVRSMKLLFV
ncbi:hypothetical protein C1H46_026652 [Malus baccata]|uniref:Protein kinase domain-containing protein n=1 Tax=Malus baccata TaxID=106549 RepID=A0A540LMU2_MALBA|nr:hypothetical protein C1H46_026652 [Malus baccata]